MGTDRGAWREMDDWPPPARETRYFLRSASGDERRLLFQEHPTLEPGALKHSEVFGAAAGAEMDSSDRAAPGSSGDGSISFL